ncbi:MAG: glycosyltransferase family 2 protein [Armatimonadetes bacterium]|nr:glycosyltransferase family 2 protein [Armatimonadota bacterium]
MTKLTIIIPVYNELETLPQVLEQVHALPVDKEVLIIDNVSTDGTREWLAEREEAGEKVVFQEVNLGKGNSVRTGIGQATGEFLVIQDADLEYEPRDILRLLETAEGGHAAVFGSRLLGRKPAVPWHHALGRDLLNLLFRLLYGCPLTDVATCYKLLHTAVAQSLKLTSTGFDLDYEIACRLRLAGVPIVEIPIEYRPRTIEEGKKLRWTDGVRALNALLRYRLGG